MSKRIEQSRQDGRVSVVTPRNPPARGEDDQRPGGRTEVAFRFELCDRHGSYVGTFVTEIERWQVGAVFTTGDGRDFRILGITTPERSSERPAYTDRWKVEATQARPS